MKRLSLVAATQAGVNFDIWEKVPGMRLGKLRKDPRFPNNPDKTELLTSIDTPVNRGNDYGGQVTTYYLVSNHILCGELYDTYCVTYTF